MTTAVAATPTTTTPALGAAARASNFATALNTLTEVRKANAARADEEAVTMLKSPAAQRKEARDATRTRVKQTVERLKNELKLIKQMWAGDAKGLARQISRIAKELKAAMADYADAAKANGETYSAAAGVEPSLTSVPSETAPADEPEAEAAEQTPDAETKAAPQAGETAEKDAAPQAETDPAKAVAAYARTADDGRAKIRSDAEQEAKGDLEFAREVRDFVRKLRDALQESRVRHAFDNRDRKGQETAEKDAAKGLSEVEDALHQMETDIKVAIPTVTVALPT